MTLKQYIANIKSPDRKTVGGIFAVAGLHLTETGKNLKVMRECGFVFGDAALKSVILPSCGHCSPIAFEVY